MIVVDSSVWINFIRGVGTRNALELKNRLDPDLVFVGDLVLLEVLQGCRTGKEVIRAERLMTRFASGEMTSMHLAREAATNYRKLRQRGITPRSTIDVMIATYCIDRDDGLLTEDRDFKPMAQHLGLRLI